jgi:hypothetical protein
VISGRQPHRLELDALFGEIIALHGDWQVIGRL